MPLYRIVEVPETGGGCLGVIIVFIVIGLILSIGENDSNQSRNYASESYVETVPQDRANQDRAPTIHEEKHNENGAHFNKERYVNKYSLLNLQGNNILLLAVEGNNQFTFELIRELKNRGVNVRTGILKPTIYESKIFDKIVTGNFNVLRRLGLSDISGYLLLYNFSYGELNDLGLNTIRAYLTVNIVSLQNTHPVIRQKFNIRGSGFTANAAKEQAKKRILKNFLSSNIMSRIN